jgi:hypothetical protein
MHMRKPLTIIVLLAGAVGAYAQGTILLADYGLLAIDGYGPDQYGDPSGYVIDIFSPQLATPTVQTFGQSFYDSPSGSTVYTGQALGGANTGPVSPTDTGNGNLWTVAFYAAPGINNTSGLAAAEANLNGAAGPFAISAFQTSGGTGTGNTGVAGSDSAGVWALNLNTGAPTSVPGTASMPNTGGATFQLLAYYNGGATPTLANANAEYAASPVSGASEIESISALGNQGSGDDVTIAGSLGGGGTGVVEDGEITSFSLAEQEVVPEPSTIALGVVGASAFLFRRRK